MNKKIIIGIVSIILFGGIVFCIFIKTKYDKENDYVFSLIVTPDNSDKYNLYYQLKDKKIYTYNISKILVNKNNNKIDLLEYFQENNEEVIKDILNNAELIDIIKDGGTKVYKVEDNFSNYPIKIIACNTINNNFDIYIGTLKLSDSVC